MTTPRAGVLPCDVPLQGVVMFRTGERLKGPRKGIAKRFEFVAEEGFAVARAKILQLMTGSEFGAGRTVIEDENVFIKATKNARQQDFKTLSATNFSEILNRRWACITDDDIAVLASNEKPIYAQFVFEFYVYLAPIAKSTDGIRRATADRVRVAAAEIAALEVEGGERFGPIATHHLAVHHARQPEGTPLLVPEDNTMRQAQALDATMEALQGENNELDSDVVDIEVELFGMWVKVRVKRSSLRAALRLPQHDIFTRGIFHGFQPEAMMPRGEDVSDTDHIQEN
ncbi:hypothetical protein PHMEG_00029206 [Phytophthora megakarya]|uniref:Uncharacterized protein n=1 Tax=Phytophthora megakarya TaxID=4795 RepID=A0A225V391_9STRA|nr:hypothetical protein PHMEG_00029206 [Phytophthora megakarya]